MEEYTPNSILKQQRSGSLMTVESYPNLMSVEEFAHEIQMGIVIFIQNMKSLESMPSLQYAEDWMEVFQAWMEME